MRFWTNTDAVEHSAEILKAAGESKMQAVGRKEQPAIVVLRFDQLFEPDRSKWIPVQLDFPESLYSFLVELAEENDFPLNDLIVLLIFEYIAFHRLEALKRPPNSPDALVPAT